MIVSTELHVRDRIESIGGPMLTVQQVSYGLAALADVQAGTARPIEATATEDGRPALPAFHRPDVDGDESADAVYYERYAVGGRISHGWVDRVSRRIVQTG